MSNSQEFRQRILLEPDFLDYLVGKAPLAAQADVRHVLTAGRDTLFMDLQPCTGNFLEAVYESEVARVISAVDEQTNTNWETYWESAWEITKVVGDIVLIFTPFKVQLPIAALRSFTPSGRALERSPANRVSLRCISFRRRCCWPMH